MDFENRWGRDMDIIVRLRERHVISRSLESQDSRSWRFVNFSSCRATWCPVDGKIPAWTSSRRLVPGECVTTAGARDRFNVMQAFQAMPLPSSSALRAHDRMGATPIREHGDQRSVRATEPMLSLSAGALRYSELVSGCRAWLRGSQRQVPAALASGFCSSVSVALALCALRATLQGSRLLSWTPTVSQGSRYEHRSRFARRTAALVLFRAIISHRAAPLSDWLCTGAAWCNPRWHKDADGIVLTD
jgi:hypothetical protein